MDITLTLRARHMAYLVGFMDDKGSIDKIKFINQLAAQIEDATDTEKQITVTVSDQLIIYLFHAIGSKPERLTAYYNKEINDLILPQIQDKQTLLDELQNIENHRIAERDGIISFGFSFILSLK